jgi:hypothetical protein
VTWQDVWFSVAGLAYTVALIPTMLDTSAKMDPRATVPTGLILTGSALVYATMGMGLSSASCALGACAYSFLALFRR